MRTVSPDAVRTSTARTRSDPRARTTAPPAIRRAPAALAAASMLPGTLRPRIDDGLHLARRPRARSATVRAVSSLVREHHGAPARRHRIAVEIGAHGAGQHDAGAVVVAEHQRPLDGAGGENAAPGEDAPQALARLVRGRLGDVVVDALQRRVGAAVVDADHRRARHDAHVGQRRQLGRDVRRPVRAAAVADSPVLGEQPPAEAEVLLAQHDARAGPARRQRRHQARRPAADDQHVAVQEGLLVGVGVALAGGAPEPGGAADQRLVDLLPERRRPHEGLVVEAGRQQRRDQRVDRQQIEPQRRPAVLAGGDEAVVELGRGGARVGLAPRAGPQLDQRIGLLRSGRQDAARAMILERPPDQMHAVGQQRRRQRVAGMAAVAAPVEGERRAPACDRSDRPTASGRLDAASAAQGVIPA